MPEQAQRELAVRLLESIGAGDPDWDLLAPDAVWWVLGRTEYPARRFLEVSTKQFLPGGTMEIAGITQEGDRVAIEARSIEGTPDGRVYSNCYHFLVEFDGRRVRRVKEYLDTAYANEFYGKQLFNRD